MLHDAYDDGGFSGGSTDRPALEQMLTDIHAHRIDVVVVYKVDRLTRSLSDFAKMVEIFNAHTVSFVSVTQSFNTTTSMGRLTLNVLLSFAQYEREVAGERIRDKIAASKKKGLWMGGFVPAGYRANGRTLVIDPCEAETVRMIFERYLELGTVRKLEAKLNAKGIHAPARKTRSGRTIGGRPFTRGQIYKLLGNPIYCGEIQHRGQRYPGQHAAIIEVETFEQVQAQLAQNTRGHRTGRGARNPSLLAGLIVDADGEKLVASHATKRGKRYRYYVSRALHDERGTTICRHAPDRGWRLPADEIEGVVIDTLRERFAEQGWLLDTAKVLLGKDELSSGQTQRIWNVSNDIRDRLSTNDPAAVRETLTHLIERIEICAASLNIALKPVALARVFGFGAVSSSLEPIRINAPIAIRRRGIETKLIIDAPGAASPRPDQAMIRAVARARRWLSDLMDGRHATVKEVASAYETDARYVARHLPLACLSPRIVEAILAGRQPAELTSWDLLNRIDLPLDWIAQARRLGFDR